VGLVVDTNVFISLERSGESIELGNWTDSSDLYISAITVSELLVGVHRANGAARRARRLEFVETIIASIRTLAFDENAARMHAEIAAAIAAAGQPIGAHDLIIAATARTHGYSVLTQDIAEFRRVPGLSVISFSR
jgi:tRNA(fMet)-specific endonuclease VapC